eukprot:scaffold52881_cov23-Tisochrysis_lutea.AAC.1
MCFPFAAATAMRRCAPSIEGGQDAWVLNSRCLNCALSVTMHMCPRLLLTCVRPFQAKNCLLLHPVSLESDKCSCYVRMLCSDNFLALRGQGCRHLVLHSHVRTLNTHTRTHAHAHTHTHARTHARAHVRCHLHACRAADNAWCPCEHLRASVPRSVGTRTTITTTAAKGPSSSGRLTAPDSSRSRGVQGLDSSSSDVMVIDLEEEERLAQIIESDTTGNNPNTSRTSGEVGAGVATIRRGEGSAAGTSAGSFAPVNALPPSPQLWHSLRPPDLHQSVKVGRDKGRSSEHSTPLSAHIGGGRGENIRNG